MKIVLSRKGFDSSSGGVPSPILPDGTLLPLPIPDRDSAVRYDGIEIAGVNLGPVVERLTRGRVRASQGAHLDPDLDRAARPRRRGWRPLFGQSGAAERVLENRGVGPGDLFLFFGWFRRTEAEAGGLRFARGAPHLHVLFGFLEVARVVPVDGGAVPEWAAGHPHLGGRPRKRNTLYAAAGGGLFPRFDPRLRLTAPGGTRSVWLLPGWLFPTGERTPLGMHGDPSRWSLTDEGAVLRTVPRGQEFVLEADDYPEAERWARRLVEASSEKRASIRRRSRKRS